MSIHGTHRLSPGRGRLLVRTARSGAAAKAGHDLLIEVSSWEATLTLAEDPAACALELSADADSLTVLEGTGGMMELGDDDRASIRQTIHDEVLGGAPIEFRSSAVSPSGELAWMVAGELTLAGRSAAAAFELRAGEDGRLAASATVAQTDFGIKPYSTLFGALKVADEVVISFESLPLG